MKFCRILKIDFGKNKMRTKFAGLVIAAVFILILQQVVAATNIDTVESVEKEIAAL